MGDQSEIWMSDDAERERQRLERLAFMKVRKEARDELRRKTRAAKGQALEERTEKTQTLRAQKVISPEVIPKPQHSAREQKREDKTTLRGPINPAVSAGPSRVEASSAQPPPSGPGPPQIPDSPSLEQSSSIDSLASNLSSNLTFSTLSSSEVISGSDDILSKDASLPPRDESTPIAPALSRFDSDETEVGAADLTPTLQDPSL